MRSGLLRQAERLDAVASALQSEVAALAASALREPSTHVLQHEVLAGGGGGATEEGAVEEEDGARIAALCGAFVSPPPLRTEGEARLVAELYLPYISPVSPVYLPCISAPGEARLVAELAQQLGADDAH